MPRTDVVALDEALQALAQIDEQQSRIVEMRFFGGLTTEEAADVLGISRSTAKRDWKVARAWLSRQMKTRRAWRAPESWQRIKSIVGAALERLA